MTYILMKVITRCYLNVYLNLLCCICFLVTMELVPSLWMGGKQKLHHVCLSALNIRMSETLWRHSLMIMVVLMMLSYPTEFFLKRICGWFRKQLFFQVAYLYPKPQRYATEILHRLTYLTLFTRILLHVNLIMELEIWRYFPSQCTFQCQSTQTYGKVMGSMK